MSAKVVWGSQPGKERGGMSRAEKAYLTRSYAALCAGETAAMSPSASEMDCPPKLNEDFKHYWLQGFQIGRRKSTTPPIP